MLSNNAQNHLCNIVLLGNLVNKPIIRYQANPVLAVAEFTLATHSKWFDKSTNQYKEWTSFHTVKVIGDVVERSLIHAEKGDIVLLRGYFLNSKKSGREIIHATYAQTYPKGYAKSLNQIHFSGQIDSPIQLVVTEQHKELVELTLLSKLYVHSPVTQELKNIEIRRPVHIWGKQAIYLAENAMQGNQLVIDGKLSYLKNAQKSQLVDSYQAVLLK